MIYLIPVTNLDEYIRMYKELLSLHIQACIDMKISTEKPTENFMDGGIKHINNPDELVRLIVNTDGEIVGFIVYEYTSDTEVYVHRLFVKKMYRRKGYASEVIRDLAKNHSVRLECYTGIQAKEFYESLGFKNMYTGYILE